MQFASGDPPKFVASNDLKPEVSEEEAPALVVEDVISFMNGIAKNDSSAKATSKNRVAESTKVVQPIVHSLP